MKSPIFRSRNNARDLSLARELLLGVQAAGVSTYRQTISSIAAELRRCRRYERPLSVLVVALEGPHLPAPDAVNLAGAQAPLESAFDSVLFLLLGTLLRDVVRESDIVTYAAEEHLYALFLPETDAAAARQAAQRLAGTLHARARARIRAGVAEFPANGLTVEALFDRAVDVLAQSAQVEVAAPTTLPPSAEWNNLLSAR